MPSPFIVLAHKDRTNIFRSGAKLGFFFEQNEVNFFVFTSKLVKGGKRGDRLSDLDEILVGKVKAGDTESFEILVSRYQQKLFSFIYRMILSREDALDIAQETFVAAFRSIEGFRGDAKFSSWLYRIASNKSLDFLRRSKKTPAVIPELGAGAWDRAARDRTAAR